jgi:hypothetical protein
MHGFIVMVSEEPDGGKGRVSIAIGDVFEQAKARSKTAAKNEKELVRSARKAMKAIFAKAIADAHKETPNAPA